MIEENEDIFSHKLRVVGPNKRTLSSLEGHLFKYLRELKKKVGYLELSEY